MKTDLGSFAALLLLVAVIPAGKQMYLRCNTSLIPRPSHRLVLDHSQYAKTKGEGLVYFIMWMTSVITERGKVPHWKNKLEALSCSFCPKCWRFEHSRSEQGTHSWFKVKNACAKCALLIRDPSLLCLPLMSSCDKMDQAFPLCFCRATASNQKLDGGNAWEQG